jgi:NAD(P)-dependent dehydrogenase (short-subunit alcohol dehydrogenase family)
LESAREIGAEAIEGDLVSAAGEIVNKAIGALGGLDVLVVNTGGGRPGGLLDDASDVSIEQAYQSMLRPALHAARSAVVALRQSRNGRLLFLTARSVLEATPELALSSVFRSGVAAAARSLAIELAPDVLVNVVVPGQFETGAYQRFESWRAAYEGFSSSAIRDEHIAAIPLGRLGQAAELADVVTFLCSARASYITGSVIRVDGGAVRGF